MRDLSGESTRHQSTEHHVLYAFQVLDAFLNNRSPEGVVPSFEDVNTALFVTWNIHAQKRLRGCIGTLEPRPLHAALRDYALTSAGEMLCLHGSRAFMHADADVHFTLLAFPLFAQQRTYTTCPVP